jgi:large subunit ribosomal protein L13Ae
MFKKHIVIDAKGHLAGRLASYVAKELLSGQKITIIRCERLLISGSQYRNKLKVMDFRAKRTSTNPKKGPIHQRAPSQMLHRKIRGMLPHTKPIGAAALKRLTCFDGCPLSLNATKKMVVRDALRCVRLKPRSRFCCIGDVAATCGWTKGEIINKFEAKRIGNNKKWHLERINKRKEQAKSTPKNSEVEKINAELAKLGY